MCAGRSTLAAVHIRRVQIHNVRGFTDVDLDLRRSDDKLAGWTVIAGRNGAGKSTLLKAIALAAAGPASSRSLQDSFAGWIRSGQAEASVTLELCWDKAHDKFQEGGKLPKDYFEASLAWKRNGGEEPHFTSEDAKGKKLSPRRGPWADNPLGWVVLGYGPFRRASGEAAPAQRLMSGPPRLAGLVSLFREDASLVESIAWLKDIHLRALEGDERAKGTKEFVLRLLGDGLLPEGIVVRDFRSEGLIVEQYGEKLTLQDLSDGYRTVATLALDMLRNLDRSSVRLKHRDDGPLHRGRPIVINHAVVLIDEVDAHLHVSWQQGIGRWLVAHFPNVQFIVTTHSPFICQSASDRGLIRLAAPGEQERTAEHVSIELFRKVVNGGADDAVVSELFGLETPYSPEASRKREDLALLESRAALGPGLAAPERRRLKQLQLELGFSTSTEVANALRDLEGRLAGE